MNLDPTLMAECQSIRDMLLSNIKAIRTGAAGGTTAIQLIAKRIYIVTLRPKVFGYLFDLIKDAIEDDMYQNFTYPIVSGKLQYTEGVTAPKRDDDNAVNQVLMANSRNIFAFIVEFNRSFVSVVKSIKFSVQYLDATYGIRCRNYTLADYAYRSIEKCFRDIRGSLYVTLFSYINDIRGGRDADLSEIRSVVRFIMEISNRNASPTENATLMTEFLTRNLEEAQKYYSVEGAAKRSRIEQEGGTQGYSKWSSEQIESEMALMRSFLDAGNSWAAPVVSVQPTVSISEKSKKQLGFSTQASDNNQFRASWAPMKEILFQTLVKSLVIDTALISRELNGGRDISYLFTLLETVSTTADEFQGVRRMAEAFGGYAKASSLSILSTPVALQDAQPDAAAAKPPVSEEAARVQQFQKNFDKLVEFVDVSIHIVWKKQLKENRVVMQGFVKGLNATVRDFPDLPKVFSDVVDAFIKKCNEEGDENEKTLFTFVRIFESISQKDEFIPNFKSRLASRLIRPGTFKHALETQFIREIKTIVGNADTHPLTSMIVDVENSKTLTNTFNEAVWKGFTSENATTATTATQGSSLHNGGKPVKVSFILATAQYWPSMDRLTMNHHASIDILLQKFNSYYTSRHNNRKISWSMYNSTAAVQTLFTSGPKEVSGTLIQITFLLIIDDATFAAAQNDSESNESSNKPRFGLSPKKIADITDIPLDVVRDTLASITFDPRFNVLSHFHPTTGAPLPQKVIKDEFPHFGINLGYKSQTKKFELPKPRSAKSNNSDQQRQIEDLRKLNAQISVIRYMKSRGTSGYQDMVTAVLADLRIRFDAQPILVKHTLDLLIEKEYIRRSEDDFNQLIYIA